MNKDERIAELERELAEKDELIKQLGEANKFLSSDKAVSTEQVKQIAREAQLKFMKENIEIIYSTIRHEICEKIRNFMIQDSHLTKEELIECLESFTAKEIFQLLDQIERGEE